jgi:uncharacterized membrane protein SirB2
VISCGGFYAGRKPDRWLLAELESGEMIKTDLWKILGVILSALWLLVAGYFLLLVFFFAEDAPRSEWLRIRLYCLLTYSVFGLAPVLGFILLMKRRYEPLGFSALTVLASLAAIPIVLILLYLVLR